MKGLLYKNFMSYRKTFVALGIIFAFVGAINITITYEEMHLAKLLAEAPEGYIYINCFSFLMIFLLGIPLCAELFTADETPVCFSFFFSAPLAAKGLLLSKYYFLFLIHLGILFGCFLIDTVMVIIMGEYAISTITVCLILFSITLILLAIRIPFYIRFGSKSSSEVQALYMFIFSSIFVIYGLFGDISFLFEENIEEALIAYLQSGKVIFVCSLIPYAAILIYYLSYRLSLILYRKGVETYDQ